MRKLIIIRGERGCGKTTEAMEIVGGEKCVHLAWWNTRENFGFAEITEDTKWLVFDELKEDMVAGIQELFKNKLLTVDRMAGLTIRIPMPNIIVIILE